MKVPRVVLSELAEYQAWADGKQDFDLLDFAMCTATPDHFVAFLEVTEPELVEYEGELFLASHFDVSTHEKWRLELGDPREIQKVMNHLHIASLFQAQDVSDQVASFLAQALARRWNRAFGHLGLEAMALGDGLEDAQVTLFRKS